MKSELPTPEERLEFVRHARVLSEWNIRTLEMKAQISIVAFVLSLSPLWSVISSACAQAAWSLMTQVLFVIFLATILLFVLVMLPAAPAAQPTPIGAWPRKVLFAAGDPNRIAASLYADHVTSRTSEVDLAAETLNLARTREIKMRRFKHALKLAFVCYVWSLATFLMLRNC
jgi:hypothetical protein